MEKIELVLDTVWTSLVYIISTLVCLLSLILLGKELVGIYNQNPNSSIDRLVFFCILLVCSLFVPILRKIICSIHAVKYRDIEITLKSIDYVLATTQLSKEIHSCIYSNEDFSKKLSKAILDDRNGLMNYTLNEIVEYRERIVFEIIQAKEDIASINNRRSKLNRLIPIMEVIIRSAKHCKNQTTIHKIYAQMSYILKDCYWPKDKYQSGLKKAYDFISDAIENRTESVEKYTIYEFNRLVLGINIEDEKYKKNIELDLNCVKNDPSCVHMLSDTNTKIAPNLFQWLDMRKDLTTAST